MTIIIDLLAWQQVPHSRGYNDIKSRVEFTLIYNIIIYENEEIRVSDTAKMTMRSNVHFHRNRDIVQHTPMIMIRNIMAHGYE